MFHEISSCSTTVIWRKPNNINNGNEILKKLRLFGLALYEGGQQLKRAMKHLNDTQHTPTLTLPTQILSHIIVTPLSLY